MLSHFYSRTVCPYTDKYIHKPVVFSAHKDDCYVYVACTLGRNCDAYLQHCTHPPPLYSLSLTTGLGMTGLCKNKKVGMSDCWLITRLQQINDRKLQKQCSRIFSSNDYFRK